MLYSSKNEKNLLNISSQIWAKQFLEIPYRMKITKYLGPLSKENPILVQMLGVCSALAVTAQLKPAVVMGLSATVVCALGNVIISILRKSIPPRIRIIVQLLIISTLVILVDQLIQAFLFEASKMLSIFVGLIITNCIIMGRFEAFSMHNKPLPSFFDGLFNGIGYSIVLVIIAFVRELFGAGTLWGVQIIPEIAYQWGYMNNGLFLLPPMALILAGLLYAINKKNFGS